MKAFCYMATADGRDSVAGTGMVTGEYKTLRNLLRFGVRPKQHSVPSHRHVRVEVYRDWSRRYQPCTETYLVPGLATFPEDRPAR